MLTGLFQPEKRTPSDCSAAPTTRKKSGLSSPSHSNLMVFYRSWRNTSQLCLLCGEMRHAQRNVEIFTFIVIAEDRFKPGAPRRISQSTPLSSGDCRWNAYIHPEKVPFSLELFLEY
ncbi:hypothetical protein CDAR_171441 [Caerostris darwini]|uniref:Uncharacterized protein n=1 Tax=Caerostris darwini TaxID=1538125 RepID=A0AAV4WP37_9ARAC|nr:hypothetical protein CDAR_171441 [Caerostris darwini]